MNGLTTLDADTARALMECKCEAVWLCGLTMLDAETAEVLAGSRAWNGELRFAAFDFVGLVASLVPLLLAVGVVARFDDVVGREL